MQRSFSQRSFLKAVEIGFPLAVFGWLFFFPRPYWLCVGLAMVLVPLYLSLAIFKPRRYDFLSTERPYGTSVLNVATPALLLSFGLLVRTVFDYKLLDYERAFVIAAAAGLVSGLLLWASINGARLALAITVACAYAAGSVVHINGLSLQPTKVSRATVIEKEAWSKPHMAMVTLAVDGREHGFFVGRATYSELKRGGIVCIERMVGVFGIEVARVGWCEDGA